VGFGECREMSRVDKVTNNLLAVMHNKTLDFPTKTDRILLTNLPSQLIDCVEWASCT